MLKPASQKLSESVCKVKLPVAQGDKNQRKLSQETLSCIQTKAKTMLQALGFVEILGPAKHGGRIQAYSQNWRVLTQDPWILEVVQGMKIPWLSLPRQKVEPNQLTFSTEITQKVSVEVAKMTELGVIQKCQDTQTQFVSTLFLRPKKDGGVRPIINLKHLNNHLEYQHFKIEGIPALIDTIQLNDFMYKIDLSNAYWTVPVHPIDRKWLRFRWQGQMYEFLVWPFGLGPVPRWFTKLLKPVVAFLRRIGTRNIIYMDDLWGGEQEQKVSVLHAYLTAGLLEALGFLVNWKKSVLDPTQVLDDYLGFIIDSTELRLYLPSLKIQKIQAACRDLLDQKTITVRLVAKVIGQLVAASRAVFPAPLHYRQLQMTQISNLLKNQRRYGSTMTLTQGCRRELLWWIENLNDWNGKSFTMTVPSGALEIETDASNMGWGAVCEGVTTQGRWKEEEKSLHINSKELLAASLAIKAFTKNRQVKHVHLKTDNMTTMGQINNMGSTTSRGLFQLTTELWDYCITNNI